MPITFVGVSALFWLVWAVAAAPVLFGPASLFGLLVWASEGAIVFFRPSRLVHGRFFDHSPLKTNQRPALSAFSRFFAPAVCEECLGDYREATTCNICNDRYKEEVANM
jgi:hypothetical protein